MLIWFCITVSFFFQFLYFQLQKSLSYSCVHRSFVWSLQSNHKCLEILWFNKRKLLFYWEISDLLMSLIFSDNLLRLKFFWKPMLLRVIQASNRGINIDILLGHFACTGFNINFIFEKKRRSVAKEKEKKKKKPPSF